MPSTKCLHAGGIEKWQLHLEPIVSTPMGALACRSHTIDFTAGTLSTLDDPVCAARKAVAIILTASVCT